MNRRELTGPILGNKFLSVGKACYKNLNTMLMRLTKTLKFNEEKYPIGINLIGDIRAETGLGQSMRIIAQILLSAEIPFTIKQIDSSDRLEHNVKDWDTKISEDLYYGINLIHINPDIWPQKYNKMKKAWLNYRYNIAFWLWELEDFPDKWVPCLETVDEVWAPSSFIANSIGRKTEKPIFTIPYAIEVMQGEKYPRSYFKLPETQFLFLLMYDCMSISARKNPEAAIEAYKTAFPEENANVGLVIKINHAGDEREIEDLRERFRGYRNIYFLTENYTREQVNSLLEAADVLISLHRSEGFGLPVAEAMYLGKPVVVTNWSAVTEFIDKKNACPVSYRFVELERDIGPYKKGNRWAEPDIQQAAEYMMSLYQDRDYYMKIGTRARETIRTKFNAESSALKIKDRVRNIYHEKNCIN